MRGEGQRDPSWVVVWSDQSASEITQSTFTCFISMAELNFFRISHSKTKALLHVTRNGTFLSQLSRNKAADDSENCIGWQIKAV